MLDRDQILEAFEALADVLHAKGIEGRVFVVGGAAMALAFDARRSTRDVDDVFHPKTELYEAARRVASDLALPEDWLNDAVKGYVPGVDPSAIPVFEKPGLAVSAASARFMLAMKLRAARVELDASDVEFLANLLGLDSAGEVLQVGIERFGEVGLPARARFMVEELFDRQEDA